MFNRDWTVCSNMLTLYDHLLRTRIFTLIMNKIFIRAPKIYEEAMDTIWMYYSSSVRVAYPTRSGWRERSVRLRPTDLNCFYPYLKGMSNFSNSL